VCGYQLLHPGNEKLKLVLFFVLCKHDAQRYGSGIERDTENLMLVLLFVVWMLVCFEET